MDLLATRPFAVVAVLIAVAILGRAEVSRQHPCAVSSVKGEALCATLPVWENRAASSGRRIELNIVILPALDKTHAGDPLFLLNGGPGEAATALAPQWAAAPVRKRRDIVMVDQRGTGGSNPLRCDPPDPQQMATNAFPPELIRACRERLQSGADLTQYTTPIAMDDLDEVRQRLGYGKINLWGTSYGSTAAQIYLRRHEASVRTMVLDGVAPLDEAYPLHSAAAVQRALDIFFNTCVKDSRCNNQYPHLRDDCAAMFERVRNGAEVVVRDRDGRATRVRPSVGALGHAVALRLYNAPASSARLASDIHQAANGDLRPIVQNLLGLWNRLYSIGAVGMMLSVQCAEDIPYITTEMAEHETRGTFLGDLFIRERQAACSQWVRSVVPVNQREPATSTVPALLVSGYRDPVTPPSFAERVAKGLPNSFQIVFPDSGHSVTGACGRELTSQFIEEGSATGLDVSCVTTPTTSTVTFGLGLGIATLAVTAVVIVVFLRRRSRHA